MKLNNTSVLKFYRRTILIALCSIAISSHGTKFNERNPDSLVHHFHTMYLQSRSAGETGNSLRYLKLYDAYNDSLEFTRMAEERKIIEIRYDNEQKARTLNLLKQQDELNRIRFSRTRAALYITSIAVLLSALILLLVIWQIRLKALRKAVKMEQTLLLSQMNPHFVLNTLANIQSLIIRNEKEPALKYLSGFSVLVRNILKSSQSETISLAKEREIITDYLEIQKLRFGDKFDYMISLRQELQPEKIPIPPMMSQPFIENSIDHGFRFKEGKGLLQIRFSRKNRKLVIEVEDNGVGRSKAKERNIAGGHEHQGLTTIVTRERLEKMGNRWRGRGKLEIVDLLNEDGSGRGTLVRIIIPEIN